MSWELKAFCRQIGLSNFTSGRREVCTYDKESLSDVGEAARAGVKTWKIDKEISIKRDTLSNAMYYVFVPYSVLFMFDSSKKIRNITKMYDYVLIRRVHADWWAFVGVIS